MAIAQPVRDPAGRTLLERGAVLDDGLIARLKKFGVTHLEVEGAVAAGDLTRGTVQDMLDALSEEYPNRTFFGCALELRAHGLPAVEHLGAFRREASGARLLAALGLLGQVAHVFTDEALWDFLPALDDAAPLWDDEDSGDDGPIPVAGAALPGLDVHDAAVRERVLRAALPVLAESMGDADERVRLAAATALERIEVPTVAELAAMRRHALQQGLEDAHAEVALACAQGLDADPAFLDEAGRARVGAAYFEVVTGSRSPLRYLAVLGLGRLDVPGARAVLMEMLDDPLLTVRRSALYALGDLREERALDVIIGLAADADDGTRAWACRALGMLGREAAVPALIRALHDAQEHVFRQAEDALVMLAGKAETALVGALTDGDWFVRYDVCRILARVGSLRALPALKIRAGADDHRFVRQAAVDAAQAIMGRLAPPAPAPAAEG